MFEGCEEYHRLWHRWSRSHALAGIDPDYKDTEDEDWVDLEAHQRKHGCNSEHFKMMREKYRGEEDS